MTRAITVLLALGFLGGCAATQTKTVAPVSAPIAPVSAPIASVRPSEAEQAERPQRVAYALKSISFIVPDSQLMQQLKEGLNTPPPNYFAQFPGEKRDRAAKLWSQELVPEVLSRFPELKELFAGVFADILTTDELRRLAEVVDLPGAIRLQNKQPLTDQDAQDFGRLGLVALSERLQEKRSVAKELMQARSEVWTTSVVGNLMRRKPELFVDASK
ncbi:hypothetical protein [Elstera sp.]|uniref:hypothetical protein n=1 Tax=Elstera sp. TaxID=1916664 RepID=UPI0037C13A20